MALDEVVMTGKNPRQMSRDDCQTEYPGCEPENDGGPNIGGVS